MNWLGRHRGLVQAGVDGLAWASALLFATLLRYDFDGSYAKAERAADADPGRRHRPGAGRAGLRHLHRTLPLRQLRRGDLPGQGHGAHLRSS